MDLRGKWERPSLLDRLLDKIEKNENGCWIWTGGKRSTGYGTIWVNGRNEACHRVSLFLFKNHPIRPKNKNDHVDHLCRVPICCNPDHLEPVTARENVLRGKSPVAALSKRTHCNFGHEFSGYNLVYYKSQRNGKYYRTCRTCSVNRTKRYREEKLNEANKNNKISR